MPISLQCPCGRALRVKDNLAGLKIKCPDCAATLLVPTPEPADEAAAEIFLTEKPSERSARKPTPRRTAEDEGFQTTPKPPPRTEQTDPDEADVPERRRRAFDEDEEEDDRRRRRDPQRRERRARLREIEERAGRRTITQRGGGGFGGFNAGVGGGLVMMVIAIVWFVGGLAIGITFIYPPIMFVIGLIAFIRGLVQRE